MPNPNGPYPGRQLFLGLTVDRRPCFAYLVTGRSPESRQRKAVAVDNTVRIGPLGNAPYDPLRHYTAVRYDSAAGIAAVSNGIHTEAIHETYKLLFNVGAPATVDFMAKLLDGANAEPDSLHTPRIAGIILGNTGNPVFIIGIKTHDSPAAARQVTPPAGSMSGVSTYSGDLDNPVHTDPSRPLPALEFKGDTAPDLARYLYDISAANYRGDDIRVCAVGGIYSGAAWEIDIVNKY